MRRWWYVLVGPLTLGILAWTAFLYLGIRARKRTWLGYAAIYLAVAIAGAALAQSEGDDASGSGFIWIGLMGASFMHALALRKPFERRMRTLEDPALEAAETRAERRELARAMAADDPKRARELGIGRPDLERSFHAGLVDVNSAPTGVIAEVAGLPRESAETIAAGRPYSSIEDLDLLVNLPREQVSRLRDVAVFIPPA